MERATVSSHDAIKTKVFLSRLRQRQVTPSCFANKGKHFTLQLILSSKCSIVAEGDILTIPVTEPQSEDQLRAHFFCANIHKVQQEVVYFKIVSMKPCVQEAMVIDAKKTRVVLQVNFTVLLVKHWLCSGLQKQ